MFSIIIPSWNNLKYLEVCISSIVKNSKYKHQIIVHVNDGSDGTLAYLQKNNIAYTSSLGNVGICFGVNSATSLSKHDYIVYMNDDMYVCPNWDGHIIDEIQKLPDDNFMLSGTLIEPKDTKNPCVINQNFGTDLATFREDELLKNFTIQTKKDWCGSAWPPTIVSKKMWLMVGGYSTELSPGMSSDDDFAIKMWHAGCRIFKGIGSSRIYHFQAKSTLRINKNKGSRQFLFKWGINQSGFNKYFLKRGAPYTEALSEPPTAILKKEERRARLKTFWYTLRSGYSTFKKRLILGLVQINISNLILENVS